MKKNEKILDYNQKVQKYLLDIFEKELTNLNNKKNNKTLRKTQSTKIYNEKDKVNNYIKKLKCRLKLEKQSNEQKILSKLDNFNNLKTFLNFGNIFKQLNIMDFESNKVNNYSSDNLESNENLDNNECKKKLKYSKEYINKLKNEYFEKNKNKIIKIKEKNNNVVNEKIEIIFKYILMFEEKYGITIEDIWNVKNLESIIHFKNKNIIKNDLKKKNNFYNNNNFLENRKNLPDVFFKNWTINKKQEFFKEFKKITNFIIKGIDKSSNQIYSNRINDSLNRIYNIDKKSLQKMKKNLAPNNISRDKNKVRFNIKDEKNKNRKQSNEKFFVIKNVKNYVKSELKTSNNIFNFKNKINIKNSKNDKYNLSTKYSQKFYNTTSNTFKFVKKDTNHLKSIKKDFKDFNKLCKEYEYNNLGFNRKILNKAKLHNKFKYEEELDIFKDNWKNTINDINNINFFSEKKLDLENQLRIYRKQNNLKEINKILDLLKDKKNNLSVLSKLNSKKKNKIIWTTCNYFKNSGSGIKFINDKLYYN